MDISKIQINNVNYNLKDTSAIASGTYDSSSQKIVFKNKDNVVICQIDATPFVVDGMVSNVAVSNGNLVITFNTDAGKSPISIPLTDIFNPAEYYTKIGYFVCDTAANTAAKTINAEGFVLSTGGSIKIKMTNDNTANNATLNINSTGAKPLYYAGLRASSANTWESGETIEVYYDGTNYMANNVAGGGSDGVFDVSAKTGDTYESLSAALTAMNALPAAYKKGGMSIKYVQSSDNKYVQYRLMSDTFNTTEANWQGVDDKPVAGSKSLAESGGVYKSLVEMANYMSSPVITSNEYITKDYFVTSNGTYGTDDGNKHASIKVSEGWVFSLEAFTTRDVLYTFANSDEPTAGGQIDMFGNNVYTIKSGTTEIIRIPAGCNYLLFNNRRPVTGMISRLKRLYSISPINACISEDSSCSVIWKGFDKIQNVNLKIGSITVQYSDLSSKTYIVNNNFTINGGDILVITDGNLRIVNSLENPWLSDYVVLLSVGSNYLVDGLLLDWVKNNGIKPDFRIQYNSEAFSYAFPNITLMRLYDCYSGAMRSISSDYGSATFDFSDANNPIDTLVLYTVNSNYRLKTINHNNVADDETVLLIVNSIGTPLYGKLRDAIEAWRQYLLETDSSNHATVVDLSLNEKVLERKLFYVTEQNYIGSENSGYLDCYGKYKRVSGARKVYCYDIDASKDYLLKYSIASTENVGYALYNYDSTSDKETLIAIGKPGIGISRTYEIVLSNIDSRANRLYLGTNINNQVAYLATVNASTHSEAVKTICPIFTYDVIKPSNGDFSINDNFTTLEYASTVRFIKCGGGFSATSSIGGALYVYCYDKDFIYLGYSQVSIVANTKLDVIPAYDCTYIKLMLKGSTAIGLPIVKLDGFFDENWDVYNQRSSDNGYHRISVLVNVTNPNCCDEVTSDGTVKDSMNLRPDYGVICLPDTYTNMGVSTRLIIYCHGGNVNYSSSATRFDTQDLEPEYWLAEGYAILDIEGNPFNNTNEHFHIPQAMDCYVAAYKWAIEHYNLKRDGIFLGGRSMGGGMTFNLLRCPYSIPVIAACPNAAHGMCAGGTTPAGTLGGRQEFYAIHCGFDIPNGFDWNNATNPYYKVGTNTTTVGSKKKLFYDNWDKLVKNTPIWTLCTDLPTDDTSIRELVDNFYVSNPDPDNYHPSQRVNLWSKLHAMSRCPIKLFGCYEDESCPPEDTALLYYRMLTNAAQIAEVRLFHSYKDYTGTGTTAHHYDTQDPALRADVTTKYGEQMTNIPVVYIEMLQFWRRYEQL